MKILKAKKFIKFDWVAHEYFIECVLEDFTCNVYFIVGTTGSMVYQAEVWKQLPFGGASEQVLLQHFDSLSQAVRWCEFKATELFTESF